MAKDAGEGRVSGVISNGRLWPKADIEERPETTHSGRSRLRQIFPFLEYYAEQMSVYQQVRSH